MKKAKTIVGIILCAVMAASLCACSMVFVNEERDMQQVVAEVNGTNIYKQEFMAAADSISYNSYGTLFADYAASISKSDLESFIEYVIGQLVDVELLFQQAQKEGLVDDSPERRAEIEAQVNEEIESMRQSYTESAEASEDIEDVQAYVEESIAYYKEIYGYNDMETFINDTIRSEAVQAMQEQVEAEVTYTEEEARELYDMQVEGHVEAIAEDPSMYELYTSMSSQVFARPEGSRFVKNLLIAIPEEAQTEIATLRNSDDNEAADALRDEELAKIRAAADEALARLKEGEDFDALMEEIGEDTGMQSEPEKTEGYLVYEGSGMVEEFEAAALALQNEGDISDLVATDYGYHIILYVRDASGQIPFEEVRDELMESGLASAQETRLTEFLTALEEESTIKTFPGRATPNT